MKSALNGSVKVFSRCCCCSPVVMDTDYDFKNLTQTTIYSLFNFVINANICLW